MRAKALPAPSTIQSRFRWPLHPVFGPVLGSLQCTIAPASSLCGKTRRFPDFAPFEPPSPNCFQNFCREIFNILCDQCFVPRGLIETDLACELMGELETLK